MQSSFKFFSDMRLRWKMPFIYIFVIIIPFIIFTLISSNNVSNILESMVKYSARQSFDQSSAFIAYKINQVVEVSDVLITDDRVTGILSKDPKKCNIYEQVKDLGTLRTLIDSFINKNEIANIKFYVNDLFVFTSPVESLSGINTVNGTDWYNEVIASPSNIMWVPSLSDDGSYQTDIKDSESERRISLVRKIFDQNNYSKVIGLLRIDVDQGKLLEILKKSLTTQNSLTYIINSKGQIMSSTIPIKDTENVIKSNNFNEDNISNKNYISFNTKIPLSDWTIVSVITNDEITKGSREIKQNLLIICFLIGIIAFSIASMISNSITKRITLLNNNIKSFQSGNFEVASLPPSRDEIGELLTNFNNMCDSLSFHIKEQFRLGQEAKNFELIALQAQINPHFLYNTLDLINWTAINNNVPEISEIVQSLSKFFKLSLSKGLNFIPIIDEVEHVKLYVDIQNRRYNNIFNFEIQIEEQVYKYTTIKMILQPIIENSMIHGILPKKEKTGFIKLTGYVSDGIINLVIRDNGVGMSEEKLASIFSDNDTPTPQSYGIKNINKRIKLCFGEEYGLSCESSLQTGTVVKIRFPAVLTCPEK